MSSKVRGEDSRGGAAGGLHPFPSPALRRGAADARIGGMQHVFKAFRFSAAAVAALVAAAALSGCGPGSRIERLKADDRALSEASEKARAAQLAGRVDEAREIYEDIVAARPSDPYARLQLGILLHDLAGDPYSAIGEYRAYLRLAPGSDKEEMVRERMRTARDQIARRASSGDAPDAASLPGSREQQRRISELEAELAESRSAAAAAFAERDRAKSEADRLQREILAKDRQLDVFQRQGVVSAPSGDLARAAEEAFARETATAAAAPEIAAAPRTYKVRRGDALWSIAQKAYGDASRMADIRAANRDVLGGSDRLVEGMVLTLPPY